MKPSHFRRPAPRSEHPNETREAGEGVGRGALLLALGPAVRSVAQKAGGAPGDVSAHIAEALSESGFPGAGVTLEPLPSGGLRLLVTEPGAGADLALDHAPGRLMLHASGASGPDATALVFVLPDERGEGSFAASLPAATGKRVADLAASSEPEEASEAIGQEEAAMEVVTFSESAANTTTVTQAELLSLATGIDQAMKTLHARLVAEVLAEVYPLVGDGLEAAATGGEAALEAALALGTAISDALNGIATAASRTADEVRDAVNAALTSAGFSAGAATVTVSGGVVHLEISTQKLGSYLQALAPDLGMPGLGADGGGTGTLDALFDFDLDFATGASGFFLDTTAPADVSLSLDLGGVNFDSALNLSGQGFVAADAGTSFSGSVGVDISGPGGTLTLGELGAASLSARLDGSASLSVGVEVASKGEMTPPIGATLSADWGFTGATIDPTDTNADFGDLPDLGFETVTLDLGTFMEEFIGPLVRQINDFLDPIRPIIEVLDASIKILEEMPGLGKLLDRTGDGRVNLLDVMKIALPSVDLAPFETLVRVANDVSDWAAFLESRGFAEGNLILGDIDLGSFDLRLPGVDLTDATAGFGGAADALNAVLSALSGTGWDSVDSGSGKSGREILEALVGDSVFDLPILTDPDQWMNLLLGQSADLVGIDLPEITIGLTEPERIKLFSLPVFLGVNVLAEGWANAKIDMDFGFDTRGLLDDTLNAIDGLHIVDDPGAEVMLEAGVALGVKLNAFVASVYGGGHVQALFGNEGDDELDAEAAGSTLVGGEGDDTYFVRGIDIWVSENGLNEIAEGSDSGYD